MEKKYNSSAKAKASRKKYEQKSEVKARRKELDKKRYKRKKDI